MGTQRVLIIGGGAVAMLILMLLRRKTFPQVQIWKYPLISILLTFAGVAGAMLMHFVESGHFGGTSFFGAILFVPVLMLPALLLRVPYGTLMALCAPAECLMLAFMKVDCLISDCCIGKYLPALDFQFPSQIVEMLTALVIMLILAGGAALMTNVCIGGTYPTIAVFVSCMAPVVEQLGYNPAIVLMPAIIVISFTVCAFSV